MLTTHLITDGIDLDHLVEVAVIRCCSYLSLPFLTVFLGRKSLAQPPLISWKGEYANKLFGILLQVKFVSSPLYLFNHLFIKVQTHFFYTLVLNAILCYLNCCSFGCWELFLLAPVSLGICLSLCFLSTSLLFGTVFSRLTLYIWGFSPRISHVSKPPWFLSLENDI